MGPTLSKPAQIGTMGSGITSFTMKKIESSKDLAINGAPPMFVEPLHVGRPNIGSRERFLRRTNEMLDRGWLSNNGPLVQEFERKIVDYLGVAHCVAMCNG